MIFTSLAYVFFFPFVCIIYFLLPHRARWAWLLLASCWFYMAFIPMYILVLLALILVDYAAGLAIEGAQGKTRRLFLIVSCCANLGILFFFKYSAFLYQTFTPWLVQIGLRAPPNGLLFPLPIGLSFHTFQSLGYTIDVYRGDRPAERHFGLYALYVMFFPQLVAGPIERSKNLLSQLHTGHSFDDRRVVRGLQLMLWGYFQKIVLADHLAPYVDQVYANPRAAPGLALLVATVFFAFQIYFDFCGYSDIAIGSAEVLGFRLMRNFNAPYLASSVVDFWRRWHISLSTWFRDYLYIPLGGNRCGRVRQIFNILVVFVLSGFWHGANWTYGVWGFIHGLYIVGYHLIDHRSAPSSRPFWARSLAVAWTFILVCFAWIFFRATTVSDALLIIGKIGSDLFSCSADLFLAALQFMGLPFYLFTFYLVLLGSFLVVEHIRMRGSLRDWIAARTGVVRWTIYYAAVSGTLLFAVLESKPFIYFQF